MTHHDGEPVERPRDARTPAERRADHETIDRLADELLPALVAKLGASGLGELDVREGSWHVRLRMPGDGRGVRRGAGTAPRGGGRDGHGTIGHAAAAPGANPTSATGGPLHEPAAADPAAAPDADGPTREIATSPAVGFFRPRSDLPAGARVRAGDRLGTVDVLGVPHELVAPVDGIVGASLVEAGAPVEYGQDVVEIELLDAPVAERGEGA